MKSSNRCRQVLLVDRHSLMRGVVARWVNGCSGLEVCGGTGSMTRALQAVNKLHPDVVVSEIMQLPSLNFIRELHRRHPRLPILVFTVQDKAVYEVPALAAGARDYLMKEAGGDELVRRIRLLLCRGTPRSRGQGTPSPRLNPAAA
jgi:DNA-binding NarL/FixJ family response regulator